MQIGRGWAAWIGVLALATACVGTPTEPSPTPLTLSLDSGVWTTISDPQFLRITNEGGALTFDLPTDGSISYLYAPSGLAQVHGTLVVSFNITTDGPVLFNSLEPVAGACVIPPSVRPFIWAHSNGEGIYDRWWANTHFSRLAAGAVTLTVPLKPEHWSSVNGRLANADTEIKFNFERALLNMTRLGLTFGGGCSFGHGINVSGGTARFALTEFRVQ